jgi:hypothetical protein
MISFEVLGKTLKEPLFDGNRLKIKNLENDTLLVEPVP